MRVPAGDDNKEEEERGDRGIGIAGVGCLLQAPVSAEFGARSACIVAAVPWPDHQSLMCAHTDAPSAVTTASVDGGR